MTASYCPEVSAFKVCCCGSPLLVQTYRNIFAKIARVDGFDAGSGSAQLHLSPRSRQLPTKEGEQRGKFELPDSDQGGEEDDAATASPAANKKRHGKKKTIPKAAPELTLPWSALMDVRLCADASS
jgi:hypothetical protein